MNNKGIERKLDELATGIKELNRLAAEIKKALDRNTASFNQFTAEYDKPATRHKSPAKRVTKQEGIDEASKEAARQGGGSALMELMASQERDKD